VLKIWAEEGDEHAGLLMEYRSLAKVRGTYIDGMLERVWTDGRIHPVINQHIAVTGRLSSSNPNLQNIPRPDDDIWGLRGAFMPGTGMTLVAIDYRQLEMRLLAHMSGDENMRGVIKKGWDIHAGTAALMYEKPYEEIQEAKFMKGWLEHDKVPRERIPEWVFELTGFRQDAKAVGFGINYGEGIPALAQKLGISKKEAAARKEKYFEPYPGVKEFIDYTHASCRETLEVHTILGRKRRLLEADADWKEGFYSHRYKKYVPERPGPLAARALRQAVNAVIQGSAADTARLAQILCEPKVLHGMGLANQYSEAMESIGIRQLLQVHDEIVFEVPTDSLKEGIEVLSRSMERPFHYVPEMLGIDFRELSIPLDVDAGYGEAWSEAH
jgi:DNA polymerase-1